MKHGAGSTRMTFREFNDLGAHAMVALSAKHLTEGAKVKSLEDWLEGLCVEALAVDVERNT